MVILLPIITSVICLFPLHALSDIEVTLNVVPCSFTLAGILIFIVFPFNKSFEIPLKAASGALPVFVTLYSSPFDFIIVPFLVLLVELSLLPLSVLPVFSLLFAGGVDGMASSCSPNSSSDNVNFIVIFCGFLFP